MTAKLLDPPISANRPANARQTGGARWVLFFLAVAPAALLVRLISQYGVDVPFGDEWSLIPLFAKWNDHQITFADLFRQHNEHRILVPKLLYIACAQLTHWNLRAEMFFSVFLCAVTSACVHGLIQRTDCLKQTSVSLRAEKAATSFAWSFMALLFLWAVPALPQGVAQMKNMSQVRIHGLANLTFSRVIQPTGTLRRALFIHDRSDKFERNLAVLERLNLLSPPLCQTNRLRDSANNPNRSTEEFGRCETARWQARLRWNSAAGLACRCSMSRHRALSWLMSRAANGWDLLLLK